MQSKDPQIVQSSETNSLCRLGSRGSPLAVAQTEMVKAGLLDAHEGLKIEAKIFTTKGDRFLNQALSELGGKGLFTKEIDAALLDGHIDIGVHSSKDMPLILPNGLKIAAVLPREHPADVLISKGNKQLEELGETGRIGTSSVRRAAILKHLYPKLDITPLRGNVGTRMKAVHEGDLDGTLLARAGLERLGQTEVISQTLDIETFIPAPSQGVVAMVVREEDAQSTDLLAALHDEKAYVALLAERGVLKALGGNCHTPLGAHAKFEGNKLKLIAALYHPTGQDRFYAEGILEAPTAQNALAFGEQIGALVAQKAGADLLALIQKGAS